MTNDPIPINRTELYRQVWAEPMHIVAKRYSIPETGLRKICRRHDIPFPNEIPLAWRNKDGSLQQRPLQNPENDPTIEIYPNYAGHPIEDRDQWEQAEKLIANEELPEHSIVVPSTLSDPDPLIDRTAKSLRFGSVDANGLSSPRAKNCLDVRIAKQNIDRAMRIANSIVTAIRTRGFTLSTNATRTTVEILGEPIRFTLEETLDRKEKAYTAQERKDREQFPRLYRSPVYINFPSGKLRLHIADGSYVLEGLRLTWADGKHQRLDDCLNSFLVGLIRASVAQRNDKIERERMERERRERERVRQEKIRLKHEEEQKLKELEQQLAGWLKSRDIRAFVQAVRQSFANKGEEIQAGSKLAEWLNWCELQADRFDPLAKSPPSILDEQIW